MLQYCNNSTILYLLLYCIVQYIVQVLLVEFLVSQEITRDFKNKKTKREKYSSAHLIQKRDDITILRMEVHIQKQTKDQSNEQNQVSPRTIPTRMPVHKFKI